MLRRPPASSSRTCQASAVAVTRPCQKLWEEGAPGAAAVGTVASETTRPPSLPGLLQTPGKSEFLRKFKLCLLYQTGVGVRLHSAKWWAWRGGDSCRVPS